MGLKQSFEYLAKAALHRIKEIGDGMGNFLGGTGFYDTKRDEILTSLGEFSVAESAIRDAESFDERFGIANSKRVTLQFIYDFVGHFEVPEFQATKFSDHWLSFSKEIDDENWNYVGIANLQNFESDLSLIDLGDGISIRGRSWEELRDRFGWNEFRWSAMSRDWQDGGGPSSFILVIEDKIPKSPENIMLSGTGESYSKALRILLAMRLHKAGEVRIGNFWDSRNTSLRLIGGMGAILGGGSNQIPGRQYDFDSGDVDAVRDLYHLIERFDREHEEHLRNFSTAIRSFTSIYGRLMQQRPDRVIDGITAMEALLPTNAELSFKLAFRVAGLLGRDDGSRVKYLRDMKSYYHTRSAIVHGSRVKVNDTKLINDDEPLRAILRDLLVGFLHLAESSDYTVGKKFYDEQLDEILLHASHRDKLRSEMQLS